MLLSEAIDALCLATKAEGRSPRTVSSYREKLSHLVGFLGDVAVNLITTQDLRRFLAYQYDRSTLYPDHPYKDQQEGKLSPFTVSSRAVAMRRLFNWLEEEEIIDNNPVRKIKITRPKRRVPKGTSKEQILALLATCEDDGPSGVRDKAMICLLLDTGCRAGGLCGLKPEDLELEKGLALVTEKGGKTRYIMYSSPVTVEALRAWLEVRPDDRGDGLFVGFNQKSKNGLTTDGVWQMINRRAKRAGIEGPVSVHGFRHEFARTYLLAGGNLGILSQTMGHEQISTTKDYYGIFTVGELKREHQKYSPMLYLFEGSEEDD
jgi:site-specific recombinase XerD